MVSEFYYFLFLISKDSFSVVDVEGRVISQLVREF